MPEIENGEIQIGKTQNFVGKLNELFVFLTSYEFESILFLKCTCIMAFYCIMAV